MRGGWGYRGRLWVAPYAYQCPYGTYYPYCTFLPD
jgi:hypothetical protein